MAEAPLVRVIKELVPFILVEVAVLLVVTYIPALSTWLPNLLSK
jgi:TRAP-type C4-dicarboxylate transport system permease large subunit